MQLRFESLFERSCARFHFYHDEIWPERNRLPYTGHGVLYISDDRRRPVFEMLQEARGGYRSEVGLKNLRAGPSGKLYEVARAWIEIALKEAGKGFAFKASFTDHEAAWFSVPYPGDNDWSRHLKYSTCLPALGVPAFALREFDEVLVTPVFDDTGNEPDKASFAAAVALAERRAANRRRTRERHYPLLKMKRIEYVDSDPTSFEDAEGDQRIDSEFVQLVDLLLGSYRVALEGASYGKSGRLALADQAIERMASMWNSPTYRFAQKARSMTVTVWPDDFGLPYTPRAIRFTEPATQLELWQLDREAA